VAAIATFRDPFVWDLDADPERSSFVYGRRPHGIALGAGTGGVAVHSGDRSVQFHDPATGKLVRSFANHPADVRVLTASPDGNLLAVGCADGTVRVWDAATGIRAGERRWPSDGVTALAFSADGRLLASAGTDRVVRVWEPRTGIVRREWSEVPAWPAALAFSPDGGQLSVACGTLFSTEQTHREDRGAVCVFDVEAGGIRSSFQDPSLAVVALQFAPGGRRLYAVNTDRPTIDVWDPASGARLRTITGLGASAGRVAFTADGSRYATFEPGRVRVWDAASDQECLALNLPDPADTPVVLAFAPDGRRLIVGCRFGSFHVFNAPPAPGDPPPVRSPTAVPPIHGGHGLTAPH
jgi:WD40 repeat protein